MPETKSVVTRERFATGLTYQEFIGQITENKDRFEEFYKNCSISAADKDFFTKAAKAPGGAARVMVIGEPWCPDVMRGMPTAARVAEAAEMEMRAFPRDKNLDIQNEFLKEGKYQSIPVVVFYTQDLQELCRWIERPALADAERAKIEAEVRKEKPGAADREIHQETGNRTRERQAAWQQESIREWRSLLAKKLGM